jgi:hypothetical protein
MFKDAVLIQGYNVDGKLVFEQVYTTYRWYEETIPLIDASDEARAFYGVRRIEGKQFDESGGVYQTWCNTYDVNGSLLSTEQKLPSTREHLNHLSEEGP